MTEVTDVAWILFVISIVVLLALDLGVFNRKAHVIKPREALLQVAVFIAAAVLFNIGIYTWMGQEAGLEFTTGYIMELMLSVDNLFVFVIVFASFCVPQEDQHKVLFYGILGPCCSVLRSSWRVSRWWRRSPGCSTSSAPS